MCQRYSNLTQAFNVFRDWVRLYVPIDTQYVVSNTSYFFVEPLTNWQRNAPKNPCEQPNLFKIADYWMQKVNSRRWYWQEHETQLSLTSCAMHLCNMQKHIHLHMCYHAENGRSISKGKPEWWSYRGERKKSDDSRFKTIHKCDRQRQTGRHTPTASIALTHSVAR